MAILSKNGHLKRYSPSYVKLLISFCTNAWHFAQMLGFKCDSWQYCRKWSFKKIFLQLRKTSLSFCTNEKNVLQREIKDWVFEFYLLTGEPSQFMISADWIIEHDLFHILCVVLEFLIFFWNGEGWDCFWLAKVLSRLSKIIYLPKVSKNKQVGWILICSK